MPSRSALLGLAALATLAATQVACATDTSDEDELGETSEAVTNGRIVVRGFDAPGAAVGKWGYDVKQDGRSRALKPALAKELFQDIGMNLLRIPVRAADAHPSRGNVTKKEYADDLDAIANVKAVKPTVDVFASVKLLGAHSFPGWVKKGGEVEAEAYATLLEDYLGFMKQNGVTVDWLGVDNESKFNEGNITPAKYNAIVADVTKWCKGHDVKVPGFIAAENYGPAEDLPWLANLWQTPAKFDHVDHVGVHVYSKHRDAGYVQAMAALADNVHGKGLWDSEMHWNDLDKDGVKFDDIKLGMLTAFDHFDQGFRAVSWWAFQPRSEKDKSAFVMSELVSSTAGSGTLPTDDGDGRAVSLSKLNSRAFKNGPKQVTVWVANYGKDAKDQWTEIANQKVASASYVQWSSNGPNAGKTGDASLVKDKSSFAMTYPSNTITRVTVTLK